MKKATLFKSVERRWNITTQAWTETQDTWSVTANSIDLSEYSDNGSDQSSDWTISLGWSNKTSWVTNSNTQAPDVTEGSNSVRLASTNSKMLSGTTEYFGMLDIVSILWEKPEFTLQDSKWNYFAYYGENLDFVQTVQTLGGNVYEMVTESEILQNQLFGDRVSYINLSTFKDIRVIMVIEIDGDVWLLQIPAEKYHHSKDYLKSLFIQ